MHPLKLFGWLLFVRDLLSWEHLSIDHSVVGGWTDQAQLLLLLQDRNGKFLSETSFALRELVLGWHLEGSLRG